MIAATPAIETTGNFYTAEIEARYIVLGESLRYAPAGDLDGLKEDIRVRGLLHRLLVVEYRTLLRKRYRLLSGYRRFHALAEMQQEYVDNHAGRVTPWKEWKIPCTVYIAKQKWWQKLLPGFHGSVSVAAEELD